MSTYVDIIARFSCSMRKHAFHCAKIRIRAEPMMAVYGHYIMSTYVDIIARFSCSMRKHAFPCVKIRIRAEPMMAVYGSNVQRIDH